MEEENKIVLFALSTCSACRKTKELLNKNGIKYLLVELDVIDVDSKNKLMEEVRRFNPRETFPTLVVGGGKQIVVGFNEEALKNAFGLA
ncbi:MAG: glutaredoxin family protein [Nitrospirae bacterium]|nr:glutaredoxin family protein [Nitrospirota bacterium]